MDKINDFLVLKMEDINKALNIRQKCMLIEILQAIDSKMQKDKELAKDKTNG